MILKYEISGQGIYKKKKAPSLLLGRQQYTIILKDKKILTNLDDIDIDIDEENLVNNAEEEVNSQ